MSEPRRLNNEDGDDFERTLLRSARSDGPSPAGKKRTLLALTLGAALAGGTSSGAAVAAPSVAATVVQWMAVGALVGTGTLVSVSALTPSETAPAPSAAQPPQRALQGPRTLTGSPETPSLPANDAPSAPGSAPAAGPEQGSPSPVPGRGPSLGSGPRGLAQAATTEARLAPGRSPALESASAPVEAPTPPTPGAPPATAAIPPATAAPATATAPATALVPDPLVGELLALDSARAALGRGDLGGARAALGRYAERYPKGKLSTEAKILGIELLLRQGNRAAAHQEASSFLQAFPQSPHAPRLRALLGISSP